MAVSERVQDALAALMELQEAQRSGRGAAAAQERVDSALAVLSEQDMTALADEAARLSAAPVWGEPQVLAPSPARDAMERLVELDVVVSSGAARVEVDAALEAALAAAELLSDAEKEELTAFAGQFPAAEAELSNAAAPAEVSGRPRPAWAQSMAGARARQSGMDVGKDMVYGRSIELPPPS